MNMTDIALELGYSDSSVFTRAFKNYFSISPSMYRKQKSTNCKEDYFISTYNETGKTKKWTDNTLSETTKVKVERLDDFEVVYVRHTGDYVSLARNYRKLNDWVKSSLDLLGGKGKIGDFRYAPVIGPDIFSGIISNTTGMSVLDFANKNLFEPLNINIPGDIKFYDKKAYAFSKEIEAKSADSDECYSYFEQFVGLMDSKSSYVRARGFKLCCAQARWDSEGKLQRALSNMFRLLHDDKPTVVRQCLGALHEVALYHLELCNAIEEELKSIDLAKYKDSMFPLIQKDINDLLKVME